MADKKVTIIYEMKDKAKRGITSLSQTISKFINPVEIAKKGLLAFGAATAAVTVLALKAAGKYEQWEIAFGTLTGSAEKARKVLQDIKDFAAKTPFELPGLIESSKKLLAFGIETEKIIPTMKMLGDIAAGVGTDKLPTLVRAFGKIRTKGRATMEELNMLLEAGVPILDELAKGYEVTSEELFKMISRGEVGFDAVQKSLENMTIGSGKFADLMSKQSESFFGIISNIKDNINQILIAVGEGLLPTFKRVADSLKVMSGNVLANKDSIIAFTESSIENLGKLFEFIRIATIPVMRVLNSLADTIGVISETAGRGIGAIKTAFGIGGDGEEQEVSEVDKEREKNEALLEEKRLFEEQKKAIEDEFKAVKKEEKGVEKEEDVLEKEQELEKLQAHEEGKLNVFRKGKTEEQKIVDEIKERAKKEREKDQKAKEKKAKVEQDLFNDIANTQITSVEDAGKAVGAALKKQLKNQVMGYIQAAMIRALADTPWPLSMAVAAGYGLLGAAANAAISAIPFADGGIVPGNNFSGDRVPARVNSGEMVLNKSQQANLFSMANNGTSQGSVTGSNDDTGREVIILTDDGSELARGTWNKQREMIRTGEISE